MVSPLKAEYLLPFISISIFAFVFPGSLFVIVEFVFLSLMFFHSLFIMTGKISKPY